MATKLTAAELKELTEDVANGTMTQEDFDEIVGAESKVVLPAITKKNKDGKTVTAYHDIDLENPAIRILEGKFREASRLAAEARDKMVKACLVKVAEADVPKALLAKHPNHELVITTKYGLAYGIVPKAKKKATALKIA